MILTLLAWCHWLITAVLSVYGFWGLLTLWLYWRCPPDPAPPLPPQEQWPSVTVQLPVYNEPYVIERLIQAAVQLLYPHHCLQIQVIDDSTDETSPKAARLISHYQQQGINIHHLRRCHRQGYKAGALADATRQAQGEFIAIFDADFQPEPDFLYQTIPHFINAPQLGMIQTRWHHLNSHTSLLTAAQAIALDKHFVLDQAVRHRAYLFPKFNGAGGIWRRTCLEDAGGWQSDTVCEDLCLSTRAILKGWHFRFLSDVIAPADLPTTLSAYKIQQGRWAKGSLQCLFKFGRSLLGANHHTPLARAYALLSMSAYLAHPLLLLLLLVQIGLLAWGRSLPSNILLFSLAGIGQPLLFMVGQQRLHRDWWQRLRHLPSLLCLSIGLSPHNSRALLQLLTHRHHSFKRTPKGGRYTFPFDSILFVELFFTLYTAIGLILAFYHRQWGSVSFLAACCLGFGYVFSRTLYEIYQSHQIPPRQN